MADIPKIHVQFKHAEIQPSTSLAGLQTLACQLLFIFLDVFNYIEHLYYWL